MPKRIILSGYNKPDENTLLLLHFDNGIKDASRYNRQLTLNGGVSISTDQKVFGNASLYLDGINDYITLGKANDYLAGDFTVDFWCYVIPSIQYPSPIQAISDNLSGFLPFQFSRDGINNPNVYGFVGNGWAIYNGKIGEASYNYWHHYVIVRKGNTYYWFIDGILVKVITSSIILYNGDPIFYLGLANTDNINRFFKGYIDEFRLSNVARWTSNFTPPTKPY